MFTIPPPPPPPPQGNLERWNAQMETVNFKYNHWRKTSQWFTVTRNHATVLVGDREVNEAFERYCKPHTCEISGRPITCSSNVCVGLVGPDGWMVGCDCVWC